MAEQKKRGRPSTKATEKTPQVKKAASAAKNTNEKQTKTTARNLQAKRESEEKRELQQIALREASQKETTKVTARGKRFGDSILDEVILLLIILVSVVVFVSLVTDKMGIFGAMIADFFKGSLGFSGLLLPPFVVAFCVWMLVSEEKKYPIVRGCGAVLFLVTLASIAQIMNPVNVAANAGFMKRCDTFYSYGAFGNGGLIGGLIGGGLYAVLDTLGGSLVLLVLLIISVVMATGKSFFHAIGDANDYRKSRKKAKREKIKQRAERVRQQEIREEERLEKRAERRMAKQDKLVMQEQKRRKMSREDFNIEIEKNAPEEMPYIKETVFRERPRMRHSKVKEPIYDYVRELEQPASEAALLAEVPAVIEQAEISETVEEPVITEAGRPMSRRAEAREAIEAAAMLQEPIGRHEERKPVTEPVRMAPKMEEPIKMENKAEASAGSRFKPEVEPPVKPVFDDTPIIDILPEEDMGKTILPAAMMPQVKQTGFSIDAVLEEEVSETEIFAEDNLPVIVETEDFGEEIPVSVEEYAFMEDENRAAVDDSVMQKMERMTEAEFVAEEIPTEPQEEEKPYQFPPIELLGADPQTGNTDNRAELLENAKKLEQTLKSFGVDAKVVQISKGPTVTRYEVSPSQGVKVSKIVNLADDIALNLAASGIRIEAPIPGKAAVGIEVPNRETQSVYMRTLLESDAFQEHPSKLAFAVGQDITGNVVVTDIAKMPHLLIAGATGSGKSVCINTLITSILYKADPKEVKLLLVDPKVVELSVYNGIPHLLIPVVTDPKKASAALNWAVREMDQRYNDFAAYGVRDIKGFNAAMEEKGDEKGKLAQIVIVVDELADLMMTAAGEVEDAIARLAQKARAAGMHLIIATQRPSVDVITGVIKANIPSRLAFAVSSGIDSRTVLDTVGAEKLLGKGDMLFCPAGQNKPSRLQGAFVTDQEVEAIVHFLKQTSKPYYTQETIDKITSAARGGDSMDGESDELYGEAVDLVIQKEKASVSMLQRQFRIGYNRAARLMDDLERRGIVGPEEGSKPRRVLITKTEWEERTGAVPDEI